MQLHARTPGVSPIPQNCSRSRSFGLQSRLQPKIERQISLYIRHQLSWTVRPLCKYSTLPKLYLRCQVPLLTTPASSTAPAALLLPTYRPISTIKPAFAASWSLVRHCPTTASTSSSGAVLGTRRIILKMEGMASGTIPVFRVKSYRVSTSLRTGKTSLVPKSVI